MSDMLPNNKLLPLLIVLTSCARTFIGVGFVDCEKDFTTSPGPLLKVINNGKTGISSISIATDSGKKEFCGVYAGDTGRYIKLPPFCTEEPHIKVTVVKINRFGGIKAYAVLSRWSVGHVCNSITSGHYSLIVNVNKPGKDMKAEIVEDNPVP